MNRKRTERSTRPLTRLWQAGREDSAGDNETCSRPPTDLRGSPAVRASPPTGQRCCGAMTAGATGGLEYSRRWGCVANTAYNKTKEAAHLGPVCLATAQTSPGEAACPWIEMEYPCWLLDTVSRGGARLKGSTFGCCLSAFPHRPAGNLYALDPVFT